MSKPMQITTSTHAMGIGAYVGSGMVAVWSIAGVASTISMRDLAGGFGVNAWALVLFAASLLAIVGAMSQPKQLNPLGAMRLEAAGALAIGLADVFYLWTLIKGYGWLDSAVTQTWAATFGLSGAARFLQIWREARRLRSALAEARPASPPPLADIDTSDQ